MKSSQLGFTFEDVEIETNSEKSFGYFWTTLVEEVVKYVCKNKSFPPQSWGYSGHGQSELEWFEADLIELADWVIHEKIKKSNQHLTILYQVKDREVASIFRLLVQPVIWAIKDKRLNSVDGNAVRLIKEILKDEHEIVLKMTTSTSDPSFEQTIQELVNELKKVPQHWDHSSPLTRRGTPRKNLPPVFRKAELGQFCGYIAGMKPLPASNQIWKAVQSVLPEREGTQAGQKKTAGAEHLLSLGQIESEDPFTKIASKQHERDMSSVSLDDYGQESELHQGLGVIAEEFRKRLTADEERVMLAIMHPDFPHLPQAVKAEALGVNDVNSQKAILNSLKEKSQSIGSEFNLSEEKCNQALIMVAKAIAHDTEVWS
jgi:hypothetical protein